MKLNRLVSGILLLGLLAWLAACSGSAPPESPQQTPSAEQSEQPPAEPREEEPVPGEQPAADPSEAEQATPAETEKPAPAEESEAVPAAAEEPAAPAQPVRGDAEAGKAVYQKKCATCHGAQGEGKAAIARMLKVELRSLGSKEVQAKSDNALRKSMVEGTGKMKPVKGLSDTDVRNLVAFLRTLG